MLNIAVIIAHYNYNHFLPDAIQSCLDQTVKNFICVVDDNSKVSPLDIMTKMLGEPVIKSENYYFKDKAVLIINDKTYGPSYSRNQGIAECQGFDAFAILDADDYMLPNKIEKMSKVIEDPNIGVVYADYYIEDEDKNIKMEFKHPYDVFLLQQDCIVHSGSMISSKWLNTIKINENEWYRNDLRVAEDYNLWLRLSKVCLFHHIPEFLTVARDHRENSTNTVPVELWIDNLEKAKK